MLHAFDLFLYVCFTVILSVAFFASRSNDSELFRRSLVLLVALCAMAFLSLLSRPSNESFVTGDLASKFENALSFVRDRSSPSTSPAPPPPAPPPFQGGVWMDKDCDEYDDAPGTAKPVMPVDGLKLLYDACRASSYNGENVLKNVAPKASTQFNSQGSCATGRDSDLKLSKAPGRDEFEPRSGVRTYMNVATGPDSSTLGIDARSSFTVFLHVRFDAVAPSPLSGPPTRISLLKLYANTQTNNGLEVSLEVPPPSSSPGFYASFSARFGKDFELRSAPPATLVDPGKPYVLTVIKNVNDLRIYFDGENVAAGTYQPSASEDVLLSNRPVTLNRTGALQGSLFAFGVYARALGPTEVLALAEFRRRELYMLSPEYIARKAAYIKMCLDVRNAKLCPLDAATCEACRGSVKDWSDVFGVMGSMDFKCRKAMAAFCSAHPGDKRFCRCFDKSDAATYDSPGCVQWRGFLNYDPSKRTRDIDSLDDDDTSYVCAKYCPRPKCPECPKCPERPKCPECPKPKRRNRSVVRLDDEEEDDDDGEEEEGDDDKGDDDEKGDEDEMGDDDDGDDDDTEDSSEDERETRLKRLNKVDTAFRAISSSLPLRGDLSSLEFDPSHHRYREIIREPPPSPPHHRQRQPQQQSGGLNGFVTWLFGPKTLQS